MRIRFIFEMVANLHFNLVAPLLLKLPEESWLAAEVEPTTKMPLIVRQVEWGR